MRFCMNFLAHRASQPVFLRLVSYTILSFLVLYSIGVLCMHVTAPPAAFPINQSLIIPEGATVRDIAALLTEQGYIESRFIFLAYAKINSDTVLIQAGQYIFPEKLNVFELYTSLTVAKNRKSSTLFTAPEGFRLRDLPTLLPEPYQHLSFDAYGEYEGYLFPDTYELSREETSLSIVEKMNARYREIIEPYRDQILTSGMSEQEVVIFASLLEREANSLVTKKMVSGILHNRLNENMPLQVDAVFDYLLDKESIELTRTDLELESPYNTYKYVGLPPSPIANPGAEAIEAVLYPTDSEYLYYLTGKDGVFHYARTFEEHKRNKSRYLR